MAHTYYADGTVQITFSPLYRDIATNETGVATVAMCTVEIYSVADDTEILVVTFEGTDDPATIAYDAYQHRMVCAYTTSTPGEYAVRCLVTVSDNPVRRGVDRGTFTIEA